MADDAAFESARKAIEVFYHAVARQDVMLLRTIVADDWQYIPASNTRQAAHGAEAVTSAFAALYSSLSGVKIEIVDVLVHGSKIGVRARVTGTQSGSVMGIPANSGLVGFAIHSFHEIHDGRITKTWHLEDWLGALRQLGDSRHSTVDQPPTD